MLPVGDDPIYLSHLPMFMAPHNYQAILKVSLDGKASGRLKDFQAHFGRDFLYTVKPEEFSIVDLLPVGTQLIGAIAPALAAQIFGWSPRTCPRSCLLARALDRRPQSAISR